MKFYHSNRNITTTVDVLRKTGAVSFKVDLIKKLGSRISYIHKTSTKSVAPGCNFLNLRKYFHGLWGKARVRKVFIDGSLRWEQLELWLARNCSILVDKLSGPKMEPHLRHVWVELWMLAWSCQRLWDQPTHVVYRSLLGLITFSHITLQASICAHLGGIKEER